jgi:hypothetical protein
MNKKEKKKLSEQEEGEEEEHSQLHTRAFFKFYSTYYVRKSLGVFSLLVIRPTKRNLLTLTYC